MANRGVRLLVFVAWLRHDIHPNLGRTYGSHGKSDWPVLDQRHELGKQCEFLLYCWFPSLRSVNHGTRNGKPVARLFEGCEGAAHGAFARPNQKDKSEAQPAGLDYQILRQHTAGCNISPMSKVVDEPVITPCPLLHVRAMLQVVHVAVARLPVL